jgi:glycosyltransferase involved in cell wall biosynthesis
MRITVVTDAWRPQVNGVVRTLERLQFEAEKQGVTISFVTPLQFKTFPMPGYPEIRLSMTRPSTLHAAIEAQKPDAIHIATEGPLGTLGRRYAMLNKRKFTTCYHTAYPQYLSARYPVPERLTYAYLRRFHNASATTMVATEPLRSELASRGFQRLAIWSRGVDAEIFQPRPEKLHFGEGPQLLYVGRVAVEKNIDAFLCTPMPGTKIIVGDGPDRARLQTEYPEAIFLGVKTGSELAEIYASANVFVFPSMTDTFGLVLLEALASGLPVAAFPAGGFLNAIEAAGVGVVNPNLTEAVLGALKIAPTAARDFALGYTHQHSTRQFIRNVETALNFRSEKAA